MDAPANYCAICGKPKTHAHHITGRAPDHAQLHPDLTVDLCGNHHGYLHDMLRIQHIDTPPTGVVWTAVQRIGYVLRRIANFIGQYARSADNPVWTKIARLLASLADELDGIDPNQIGAVPA